MSPDHAAQPEPDVDLPEGAGKPRSGKLRRLSIMRQKPRNKYTIIPNALLRNGDLSIQARGLLAFILSYPDDWEFDREWLIKNSGVKRNRLDSILDELEQKRYLRRSQARLPNGRAGPWEYLFSQEPMEADPADPKASVPRRGKATFFEPQTENREAASPQTENPEAEKPEAAPQHENRDAASLYTKTVRSEDWVESLGETTHTNERAPKTGESAQARSDPPAEGPGPFGEQKEHRTKGAAPKTRVAKPHKTPFPGGVLSDDALAFALMEGLTEDEAHREWHKMGDWYLQKGALAMDWGAAYRNWVRREVDDRRKRASRGGMQHNSSNGMSVHLEAAMLNEAAMDAAAKARGH